MGSFVKGANIQSKTANQCARIVLLPGGGGGPPLPGAFFQPNLGNFDRRFGQRP